MSRTVAIVPLAGEYAVCRLPPTAGLPGWAVGELVAVTRTPDELSVVCPAAAVPPHAVAERGWQAFRVAGTLDFAETGIVAGLTVPLAAAGIPVFVVSTYDTDYLLVAAGRAAAAVVAWRGAGHTVADPSTSPAR